MLKRGVKTWRQCDQEQQK